MHYFPKVMLNALNKSSPSILTQLYRIGLFNFNFTVEKTQVPNGMAVCPNSLS